MIAKLDLVKLRIWREDAEPYDGDRVALTSTVTGLMAIDGARAIGFVPAFGFPLMPESYDGNEQPPRGGSPRRHIY
jgi:hypothetical protein